MSDPIAFQTLRVELDGKVEWLVTASAGAHTVGCCRVLALERGVAPIVGVFVRANYRRREVGRQLLAVAERVARDEGAKVASVLVTREMVGWYAALGWEAVVSDDGSRTDGIERVAMVKRVSEAEN